MSATRVSPGVVSRGTAIVIMRAAIRAGEREPRNRDTRTGAECRGARGSLRPHERNSLTEAAMTLPASPEPAAFKAFEEQSWNAAAGIYHAEFGRLTVQVAPA